MLLGTVDKGSVLLPSFEALKSQLPSEPVDFQVCSAKHRLLLSCLCIFVAHSADFQPSAEDTAASADLMRNTSSNKISAIFLD